MEPTSTQVTPESTTAAQTTTAAPATTTPQASVTTPAESTNQPWNHFIPETLRESGWAKKYNSQDEFFKGIDNMAKMIGQKQVVTGLQVPGENATDEERGNFYKALGRPEAADKYTYGEDIKGFEGLDLEAEKAGFSKIAFEHGLSQKQADNIFKSYLSQMNSFFGTRQDQAKESFDKALVSAFGIDFKPQLDMAKRGAKAVGNADSLTLEDLKDPFTLKVLAKLGEYVGEDTFIDGDNSGSTKESILAEAKKLQASPEYLNGDKEVHAKVQAAYKKVYG